MNKPSQTVWGESPGCSGYHAWLQHHSKQVQIPVTQLCSLSDLYLGEKYDPFYFPMDSGIMFSVCQWPGGPGFYSRSSHTKDFFKKGYLMPPCLTLSIIRYGSRVNWSNAGEEVASSSTPWCCSYRKGSLQVTLDDGRQLVYLTSYGLKSTIILQQWLWH